MEYAQGSVQNLTIHFSMEKNHLLSEREEDLETCYKYAAFCMISLFLCATSRLEADAQVYKISTESDTSWRSYGPISFYLLLKWIFSANYWIFGYWNFEIYLDFFFFFGFWIFKNIIYLENSMDIFDLLLVRKTRISLEVRTRRTILLEIRTKKYITWK